MFKNLSMDIMGCELRPKILITIIVLILISCSRNHKTTAMPNIDVYTIRLKPGNDLKKSIQEFIDSARLSAAWIVTCAGSLTKYNIRFANEAHSVEGEGHFEIVGLGGTLSVNGSHLHISISDSTGKTIGGHLVEGCIIYTTAEIVIQSTSGFIYTRENDGSTPWKELKVSYKQP